MDDSIYDDMMIDVRGDSKDVFPNAKSYSNASQDWQTGRDYE